MTTCTSVRSWPAIGLGTFFAGVTGFTLFKDVADGAPVNTGHVLALAAIVAAIASGHMVWPQLRRGAVVPALLLAVLFLSSTAYVVVSSGARNAETAGVKAAMIDANNKARSKENEALGVAEMMQKTVAGKLHTECVLGKASKSICDGHRTNLALAEAAVLGHKTAIEKLGPELAPNAGYAHASKVIAALPGVTAKAEAIEASLTLLLPFLVVLIAEVGTIVFLHLGLGHQQSATGEQLQNAGECRATGSNRQPEPTPPKPGNRRPVAVNTVATRAAAEADVIRLVARGERLPSQDTLARRWGVHKGTASKWVADFERRGLIRREWDGRHKQVAAA